MDSTGPSHDSPVPPSDSDISPDAFTVLWCLDHDETTSDELVKRTTLAYDAVMDALDALQDAGYVEVITEEEPINVPLQVGSLTRTVAEAWPRDRGEEYLTEMSTTALPQTWLDEYLIGSYQEYLRRHEEE